MGGWALVGSWWRRVEDDKHTQLIHETSCMSGEDLDLRPFSDVSSLWCFLSVMLRASCCTDVAPSTHRDLQHYPSNLNTPSLPLKLSSINP